RDLNLYWDLQFVPDVSAMFAFVARPWLAAAVLVAAVLFPLLVYMPVRWALGRVNDAVGHPVARRVLGVTAAAALPPGAAQHVDNRVLPRIRFAEPVTPLFARVLSELGSDMTGVGVRALDPPPPMRSNLSRIKGADVLLIFVESYGAVSW